MNFLKHILVVVALLATMLPCCLAAERHNHNHESTMELCAFATSPCECHSCDHESCADDLEIHFNLASGTQAIEQPSNPEVLFTLPEPLPAKSKKNPPVSGFLASIQTVQLLI